MNIKINLLDEPKLGTKFKNVLTFLSTLKHDIITYIENILRRLAYSDVYFNKQCYNKNILFKFIVAFS